MDLLSLDDELLDSVFQYHKPKVGRLPSHVWPRLKGAMEGLITEGEHGCFQWYHRQLKEMAERRFAPLKVATHILMANNFGDNGGWDTKPFAPNSHARVDSSWECI